MPRLGALFLHLRFVAVICLSGCSLFLPHPDKSTSILGNAETPRDGRCSLAVVQDRKGLTRQIDAASVPVALLIHAQSSHSMREIRNHQSIYFEASRRDADRPRIYSPEMNRHEPSSPAPNTPAPSWRIESIDSRDTEGDAVLMSGSLFELLDPQRQEYLLLGSETGDTLVSRAQGSRFMVYKADVPDPTRPTTCDEQIRDEDFVFMREVTRSTWVHVSAAGTLNIHEIAGGKMLHPNGSSQNPDCTREEERCHNDSRGGLTCAWVPVCGTE